MVFTSYISVFLDSMVELLVLVSLCKVKVNIIIKNLQNSNTNILSFKYFHMTFW